MTYKLEKITTSDILQILHDFKGIENTLLKYTYDINPRLFPSVRAFDHKKNSYLFTPPVTTTPDKTATGTEYYFYYQNQFYRLKSQSDFTNLVEIINHHMIEIPIDIQESIRQAFCVFGRFGYGPEENPFEDVLVITDRSEGT